MRNTPVFATLDFEASSLEETGYPIEVGLAVGTDKEIITQFSTIIKPRPHWKGPRSWSTASEQVHGIPQATLQQGMDADQVCATLNSLLAGLTVVVDGGTYDAFWLSKLFAGQHCTFELDHLTAIAPADFIAIKRASEPRHRALPDAIWLWQVMAPRI